MKQPKLTRRRFLKRAALSVGAAATGTFAYTWRIEPHWIQVVRRILPIANLPASLLGKSLIQISDLHIGPIVDERFMTHAMEVVSSLHGDILTVTGDFMTARGTEQVEQVLRVMKHLRPGKLATIGILGNHDYAWRWNDGDAAAKLTSSLRDAGFTMLRNQLTEVEGLQIAGIDDYWSPNFAPLKVMPEVNPKQASLVLCHNPDAMDEHVWNGYRGWILSGHTHGGQCKPPFFAPPVIPVRNRRYTAGAFDLYDGRWLYINRGLGYLHRVRFNARPEITVFTLASV
jgi:predicted MPP superfamily phosphohydrolase